MLKDPYLKTDIINNELDIIIAWAIIGLFRIIDNNYEFTICKTIKDKKEDYRSDVDSVRQWANLYYKPIPPTCNEDYIKGSALLNIYKAWCSREGVKEVGRNSFYKSMNRLFKGQLKEIHKQQYYAIELIKESATTFEDIETSKNIKIFKIPN